MSALSTEKMSRQKAFKYFFAPLVASAQVYKGGLAMVVTSGANAGFFQEATNAATGVVVGKFAETALNGGANGAVSANVEFFKERWTEGLLNDTGTPVVITSREQLVYLLDDQTATGAPNNVPLGVLVDIGPDGAVYVEGRASAPEAAIVPNIQVGTSTLASGTKTVTGVTLTATSRIFVTVKDPGSGAVTGVGLIDAPVASRNTSTGQFVVNMTDDSKAVITTANSTFDWLIIG